MRRIWLADAEIAGVRLDCRRGARAPRGAASMSGDAVGAFGPQWLAFVLVALAGLAIGSFVNVVVHRLPIMLARQWRADAMALLEIRPPSHRLFNLMLPRSQCPACRRQVQARDNMPVLSWLLLRGRCRHCSSWISPRYPVVEATAAAAALATVQVWGFTPLAAAHYVLLMGLLTLALIDFETLLLPDQITLPLLWLGILAAVVVDGGPRPAAAVFGAIGGYLLLWLFYWAHKLLTRREGMGYGDFKLLAALGAWLGWRAILPVVLIASIVGILYAAVGLLRGQADRATPIPFGTFLCFGGATTLFAHQALMATL